MLSADGLIDVVARRGVYITVPDPAKIQELVEIRAVLEGHNARLAAQRGNPELLAAAGRILARVQAALSAEKIESLGPLNDEFHQALAKASENESLSEMPVAMRLKSLLGFAMSDPVVHAYLDLAAVAELSRFSAPISNTGFWDRAKHYLRAWQLRPQSWVSISVQIVW